MKTFRQLREDATGSPISCDNCGGLATTVTEDPTGRTWDRGQPVVPGRPFRWGVDCPCGKRRAAQQVNGLTEETYKVINPQTNVTIAKGLSKEDADNQAQNYQNATGKRAQVLKEDTEWPPLSRVKRYRVGAMGRYAGLVVWWTGRYQELPADGGRMAVVNAEIGGDELLVRPNLLIEL